MSDPSNVWVKANDDTFATTVKRDHPEMWQKLPAGVYKFGRSLTGAIYAEVDKTQQDMTIPNDEDERVSKLFDEFDKFWKSKDRYAKWGLTHKRGIVLHGPPGTGKTVVMRHLAQKLVKEYDGLVAVVNNQPHVLHSVFPMLNEYEPNRPMLAIMDDFDTLLRNNPNLEDWWLKILDGFESTRNGIMYLASANDLNAIPARILYRPSRIDRQIEVGSVPENIRRKYLTTLSRGEINEDQVDQLVKLSDSFTFAQIKELFIGAVALEQGTYEEVAERVGRLGRLAEEHDDE